MFHRAVHRSHAIFQPISCLLALKIDRNHFNNSAQFGNSLVFGTQVSSAYYYLLMLVSALCVICDTCMTVLTGGVRRKVSHKSV